MIKYDHTRHSAYLFRPLRSYEEARKEIERKRERENG